MKKITVRDREIITKSFKLLTKGERPSELLDAMDWGNYFNVFSSATGDNRFINPVAQYSPNTDPRYGRMAQSREGGMGSEYKRMHDDNTTILTLVPGVPQFAGLLSFINNMFDPVSAIIANKGRAPGAAFYVAQAAGSILFWPMQAIAVGIQFLSFLSETPKNTFYSVKPSMGAYVMAANGVLNDCLVHLGYIDPVFDWVDPEQPHPLHGTEHRYDNRTAVANLRHLMPDSVNDDGTIDLMRLVNKGVRKHRLMIKRLAELDNGAITVGDRVLSAENISTVEEKIRAQQVAIETLEFTDDVLSGDPTSDYLEKEMSTVSKYRGPEEGSHPEQDSPYVDTDAFRNINSEDRAIGSLTANMGYDPALADSEMASQEYGTALPTSSEHPLESNGMPNPVTGGRSDIAGGEQLYLDNNPDDRTWLGEVQDLLQSAVWSGLDAISFRVEGGGGPVTDSFSNTTTTSPLAEKFNSTVTAAQNFKFDLAGGTTGIGIVDGIIDTVKEAGMGLLSGTVIGNVPLALANNSYIKVPDHWNSSSSSLHKETYSIYCHCNYAHPYEQIMKIWVMFSLVLPLVAGFSAGASMSTSPFLVKSFSQGRSFIRTGIVESATFTFGNGETGFTKDRKPLNMRIDLNILDLEPLVTVPINRSIGIGDFTNPQNLVSKLLSDDTAYTNYLSRLTGVTYLDTVLKSRRINRALTKAKLDLRQAVSAQRMAAALSDSFVGDLMRMGVREIER